MPYVNIETSSGPFSFCYAISTPTTHEARHIVPDLPCILFLHSGYIGRECFEFQFADRNLREFNLIAIDMRGYGDTKGTIKEEEEYTPQVSARDLDIIMGKLDLPPCHIFGLAIGCIVAFELAIMNPARVASLILCSPPPIKEPEIVTSGRKEVYNYWVLMSESESGARPDISSEQMVQEVMTGTHQLLYNHNREDDVIAIAKYGLIAAKKNWAGSPEKIRQAYKTNVEWFRSRRLIPLEELQKISVPMCFIHCHEDIAYPIGCVEEWQELLTQAGISKLSIHEVPGSHYGTVTNPTEVNAVVYDAVLSCHPELLRKPYLPWPPHAPKLLTPFTQRLIEGVGYCPESDNE